MENNYLLIKLHGKNPNSIDKCAKVSINKIDMINKYKWYLGKDSYPFAYISGTRVPLHRFVWYINYGTWTNIDSVTMKKLYVDHINRDKLDATDENLRLATPAENSFNKTSKSILVDPISLKPLHHIKLKKSGYEVKLSKNNKSSCINKIKSLEEAKEIYNMMATELFGEFAVLY